ncbi:proton-conducting transporter transmembrane domain-containing protein [Thermococcus sp.]
MEAVVYLLIIPLMATLLPIVSENLGKALVPGLAFITASISTEMLVKGYTTSNHYFYVDWYSMVLATTIAWVYFFSSIASIYYIRRVKRSFYPLRLYWSFLSLFALLMIFTVVVSNLGWMWIGLEATTVVSAILIITDGKKRNVEGAWRYMIIASAGLGIAFLSVVITYSFNGTLDVRHIILSEKAGALVGLLAIIGFGTKVGLFPMHGWLPDAHGSAPSPVSAMLSGTLLPTALLVYYRLFKASTGLGKEAVYIALAIGILTVIVASILMASQRFVKRLLAYSSMDMMGVATIGMALSYYRPNLLKLVFILIVIHAFAKGSLFISAGSVVNNYGREISKIGGLRKDSPALGYSFGLSALAVTGAPPFGTFLAELAILGVALSINKWWALLIGAGLLLSFLALNWHSAKIISGEGRGVEFQQGEELIPLIMMLLALGISLYSIYLVLIGGLII